MSKELETRIMKLINGYDSKIKESVESMKSSSRISEDDKKLADISLGYGEMMRGMVGDYFEVVSKLESLGFMPEESSSHLTHLDLFNKEIDEIETALNEQCQKRSPLSEEEQEGYNNTSELLSIAKLLMKEYDSFINRLLDGVSALVAETTK